MDSLTIKQLISTLSYEFKDPMWLQKALTHRSFDSENNERLEFLGDSILNFTIAELLFKKFPNLPEGDLSRLRASLVKSNSLSHVAVKIGIGDFILLGEGEMKSAGWRRPSILADVIEAIIGAMYLDGGLIPAQDFITRNFMEFLTDIDPRKIAKDSKTELQELLQSKKLLLPKYEIVDIRGEAHAQEFTVKCSIQQLDMSTEGSGPSRRAAEQEAASYAIEKINNKKS
jgi:ribonuclease-3